MDRVLDESANLVSVHLKLTITKGPKKEEAFFLTCT